MSTIQSDIPGLPPARPEAVGMSSARLARIRPALEREVAEGRFPGGVVAIARAGRLVHLEAVGFLDAEAKVPMRPDALFAIASMTKPVCGVTALSLLEEGRLLLSDPVGAHVPPLMKMQVARPTPGMLSGEGPIETEAQRRPMTVQDAARHTTGFVYGGFGATAVHAAHPGSSLTVSKEFDAAGLAEALAATPLRHHPGEAWEYGFSTDVLGLVAGAAGGASLGTLMRQRVFEPLGMAETGYVLPEGGAARFAKALATCPLTGKPQSVEAPLVAPRLEVGGAGLVSTASDYLRFAEMLRAGGSLRRPARALPGDGALDGLGPPAGHRGRAGPHGSGPHRLWLRPDRLGAQECGRVGLHGRARRLRLVGRVRHLLLGGPGRAACRGADVPCPRGDAAALPPPGQHAGLSGA